MGVIRILGRHLMQTVLLRYWLGAECYGLSHCGSVGWFCIKYTVGSSRMFCSRCRFSQKGRSSTVLLCECVLVTWIWAWILSDKCSDRTFSWTEVLSGPSCPAPVKPELWVCPQQRLKLDSYRKWRRNFLFPARTKNTTNTTDHVYTPEPTTTESREYHSCHPAPRTLAD